VVQVVAHQTLAAPKQVVQVTPHRHHHRKATTVEAIQHLVAVVAVAAVLVRLEQQMLATAQQAVAQA
jgi:hypothetical protein